MDEHATSYNPTICVTHQCNLHCIYCYQHNHSCKYMSKDTAYRCIDDIMSHIPNDTERICISFIGGEPLLQFELIKDVFDYTFEKYTDERLVLFATTNGTLLTDSMKQWFHERKNKFVLGLSLDGTKETHDYNRSGSFDEIDIDFFVNTWPNQGPKMTISQKSIESLADNIIFLHEKNFKYINGVNLAEGNFDWSNDQLMHILARELSKLVKYYVDNPQLTLDQLMGRHIEYCASPKKERKKICGIGKNTIFYDINGKKYPCSYITPMTFSTEELNEISHTDFTNANIFIDEDCYKNCYLYPVCSSCSGANYFVNHTFSKRIKSKCDLTKIIAIYVAELHTQRILKNPNLYGDKTQLYYLIEAIKEIRERFFNEFKNLLV